MRACVRVCVVHVQYIIIIIPICSNVLCVYTVYIHVHACVCTLFVCVCVCVQARCLAMPVPYRQTISGILSQCRTKVQYIVHVRTCIHVYTNVHVHVYTCTLYMYYGVSVQSVCFFISNFCLS